MANPVILLNNGQKLPVIGLGTFKSPPGEVETAVKYAIDLGYRHLDCAWLYGNENEIGNAVKEKINEGTITRDELFIVTKLWCSFHEKDKVVPALKESLKFLQMDYVDLYLMHWPFGLADDGGWKADSEDKPSYSEVDYIETWKAMENCVRLGLAKGIGLSNFNSEQIDRILKIATIKPVVNQVECNPNLNQKKLIKFSKERGIVLTAYCPLGRSELSGTPGFPEPTINDPKVIEMGKKYNKTAAQIVLQYLVHLGVSVIPKSITPSRIKENLEIFDFKLEKEDIEYLDSCNKDKRVIPLDLFADHKYYPFHIEY